MNTTLPVVKRADLLTIAGATLAGAAGGAQLADVIRPLFVPLFVGGLFAHAVGMAARHRVDRQGGPLPVVWQWLYILCWIAMATLVVLGTWRWLEGAR
jgi:predicted PurR-regulated permease PerM